MATYTTQHVKSDLSGNNATTLLIFSIGSTTYEGDVTEAENEEFAVFVQRYIDAFRKVTVNLGNGKSRSNTSRGQFSDAKAIRQWAVDNGHDVPTHGRIPADIRTAYEGANA